MTNNNNLQTPELVSSTTLVKSVIGAALFAAVITTLVVLPAEYNIDPTGVGHKLGLTVLSSDGSQSEVADKLNADELNNEEKDTNTPGKKLVEVVVPPKSGIEYKFKMTQFEKLNYQWQTNGLPLYFDLHGEPESDTTGYFESYTIATADTMKGSFTAPFTGSHGWYWKNESTQPVSIQLLVQGQFRVIGLNQ